MPGDGGSGSELSDKHANSERAEWHRRRANMDREEWIDDDGVDCLPVFVVSLRARKFHKEYGGCTDPAKARMGYDLFAAVEDGKDPCKRCFPDDPYVETGDNKDTGNSQ